MEIHKKCFFTHESITKEKQANIWDLAQKVVEMILEQKADITIKELIELMEYFGENSISRGTNGKVKM